MSQCIPTRQTRPREWPGVSNVNTQNTSIAQRTARVVSALLTTKPKRIHLFAVIAMSSLRTQLWASKRMRSTCFLMGALSSWTITANISLNFRVAGFTLATFEDSPGSLLVTMPGLLADYPIIISVTWCKLSPRADDPCHIIHGGDPHIQSSMGCLNHHPIPNVNTNMAELL